MMSAIALDNLCDNELSAREEETASAFVPTPINCRKTALPCPDYPELVEVEFSDLQGRTYALEALSKSQLMILHHSLIAETRWLKTQPSLQNVV